MIDSAKIHAVSYDLTATSSVVLRANHATCLDPTGEVEQVPLDDIRRLMRGRGGFVCCYAPRFYKLNFNAQLLDILELYAFVHPAKFCVPTPSGVARALGLSAPEDEEEEAMALLEAMDVLLSDIRQDPYKSSEDILLIAKMMGGGDSSLHSDKSRQSCNPRLCSIDSFGSYIFPNA